jgi:peptide chain release factor 1
MKDSLRLQLQRLAMRLAELDAHLADPRLGQDINRYRAVAREQSEAAALVQRLHRYERREADAAAARLMLAEATRGANDDPEIAEMAREEIAEAQADLVHELAELQAALLPRDPDDARNAFVEIRAGAGGDESALFAGDLLRMYLRFFERQAWRTEVLSESASDLGGYKEVVLRVEGKDVYGALKFESGGHRVQRVPTTESQGRIHTSAATVVVMPEPRKVSMRITHLPTGLVAECQDDRSQHRNKAKAMAVLQARLRDKERAQRDATEAATRKSLVGSGDRSDRIRTYNFPQGRFTDHRIGLTLYKLAAIMEGDLGDVVRALQAAQAQDQLAAMETAA